IAPNRICCRVGWTTHLGVQSVLLVMAALGSFQRPRSGLVAVFGVMASGMVLVGLATLGLDAGRLGGEGWMIAVGSVFTRRTCPSARFRSLASWEPRVTVTSVAHFRARETAGHRPP